MKSFKVFLIVSCALSIKRLRSWGIFPCPCFVSERLEQVTRARNFSRRFKRNICLIILDGQFYCRAVSAGNTCCVKYFVFRCWLVKVSELIISTYYPLIYLLVQDCRFTCSLLSETSFAWESTSDEIKIFSIVSTSIQTIAFLNNSTMVEWN